MSAFLRCLDINKSFFTCTYRCTRISLEVPYNQNPLLICLQGHTRILRSDPSNCRNLRMNSYPHICNAEMKTIQVRVINATNNKCGLGTNLTDNIPKMMWHLTVTTDPT